LKKYKNFIVTLFSIVFLISCKTMTPKQTTLSDGSIGLTVGCSGIGGSWSTCYEKANKSCPSGFEIKEKEQYMIDNDLPIRNLMYRCK